MTHLIYPTTNFKAIEQKISELIDCFDNQDNRLIVSKMKSLVPEYKSNNSIYEELD